MVTANFLIGYLIFCANLLTTKVLNTNYNLGHVHPESIKVILAYKHTKTISAQLTLKFENTAIKKILLKRIGIFKLSDLCMKTNWIKK